MAHPDEGQLMAYREGVLDAAESQAVGGHVSTCTECQTSLTDLGRFSRELDEAWLRRALTARYGPTLHWPDRATVISFFLDEIESPAEREAVATHAASCTECTELLRELREGADGLERDDPLASMEKERAVAWGAWFREFRTAWTSPGWVGAGAVAAVALVLGFLIRPLLWPAAPTVPAGPEMALVKPAPGREQPGPALGLRPAVRPEAAKAYGEAMAAYDRPDFCARALPLFRRAVDLDRDFERAWFWLGVCQAMEGDAKGAIPALEQAVRLAPASGEYGRYLVWA